ncbi:MAG TPA: PEP-CTERM sorting domain-containing protein, partial [Gemmatimonadales bacterium]|nr:PEP-CTERM sorting domain-containing protein [Gemmatimonadales bacterium]
YNDTPTSNSYVGEIGDDWNAGTQNGSQWLILDLNLITPGSAFLSVTLASLTNGETWFFQVCDTGNANGTGFAGCSDYSGTSSGIVPAIYTTNLSPTDYGKRWARFTPGIGGYVVQGIETDNTFNGTFVAPEPGTMGLLATGLVALAGVGALRRRKRTR